MKAGRVLKRSTSSLITTCWTGDHATALPSSPAAVPASVQQDQHSLMDADSIFARDVPNLRAAAALEQVDESAAAADPTQPDPTLLAPPAAVEHAAAMEAPEPAPAQPAEDVEPAPAAVEVPAQLAAPAPHQPAAPAKPDVPFQPSRVQFLSPPSPKAALPVLLSQAALPQATPAAQASIHSHGSLAKEGSICKSSKDKVVSNGCWGTFCCFKADRRGRCGIFSRREH